jgi:HD-GYP domain-containing protein (c-di-GMP phosphodiesterase class II)
MVTPRAFSGLRFAAAVILTCAAFASGVEFARGADTIPLSPAEQEWLNKHSEWRVAGDYSPPFGWIDKDGVYRGMGADYDELFSKKLGTSVRAIPAASWEESMQQLQDGRCDVCTLMIFTPERAKLVNFSREILELPTVALVRTDSKLKIKSAGDLAGKTVAVVRSWAIHEQLLRDYPRIRLESRDSIAEAILAVSDGSVDAFAGNMASTSYALEKLGITNLKVACMMPYVYSMRVGVRKDWPELVPILDRAIEAITEEEQRKIITRWMPVRVEGWTLEQVLRIAVPVVLVSGLLLLGYHLQNLRREIDLRRAAEEAVLETQHATIVALSALAETRDSDTGAHLERTQRYVKVLAEELQRRSWNNLTALEVDLLSKTAPLHDVGKVGIPDAILNKPGQFTDEEYAIMKTHTTLGAEALEKAGKDCHGSGLFLKQACEIALTHHEKWDGTGYPQGLKGKDIPPGGRIMAVADVYDALRSKRIYKEAMSHERAVEIICEDSGKAFDPAVVEVFRKLGSKFDRIAREFSDEMRKA